jgi:hypothetical protein
MHDDKRRRELLVELDRTDGPWRMKLGYLQQYGFPVFSDWYVEDKEGCLCLKDDRCFHVFANRKNQQMRPSG